MAVPANQPRQGGVGLPTVVYLALEDREWRVQQRMQELTDSPPENLRFGFSCGQLGAELEGQIEEALREFPSTGLILIDAFQMVRDNASEKVNAYAQDYKDLSGLKKLADDHGICIFVVHHTRKERDSSNIFNPRSVTANFSKLLEQNGPRHIRFHDLRHPYVKHTTKIFSLRLMDFQAQAYPDARRKTRGACQLHRGGQSQSPVRPLCNRKRFSYLPPQAKMSWILYAISMRLSGYTSTRSISSSASSVVSVSASKIALDASLRLSCRACSSCFCFACANTAA